MSVGLMQRVCAGYRVPLFDMLADSFNGGLDLYAGDPRQEEMIDNSRTPNKARLWKANNIDLFSGKYYLCIQRDVLKWLKDRDPRALIMEANMRYPMSAAAANWMHQHDRPVIGWGLGTGGTGGRMLTHHLARYDAMITYSTSGKMDYIRAGFPEDRIFIACNAAAPRPNRSMPQRPTDHYHGAPIILYVGRLQHRKRLDLLMKACAAQPERLHPRLWIVGNGPIRSELEAAAAKIYPETEFFGALYGEELTARFDRADLFCLPGTGGLALQQAMSSALPLIAGEADGTQADLIRPGNGITIQPGDEQALTKAITDLLSNPVHLRKMGEASFRIVKEEINLESMAEVFIRAVKFAEKNRRKA